MAPGSVPGRKLTHFIPCPTCGQARPEIARYPHAVCSACAAQPMSSDGRPLQFGNLALSGGLDGRYADSGKPYTLHECFVRGVGCQAEEASIGGIVIQIDPTTCQVVVGLPVCKACRRSAAPALTETPGHDMI